MAITDKLGIAGKRGWAAWGILAGAFAALFVLHLNAWWFVGVSAVFIGYTSWTVTGYLASQRHFSTSNLTACVWPIGIAVAQVVVCLAFVWMLVWLAGWVFGADIP